MNPSRSIVWLWVLASMGCALDQISLGPSGSGIDAGRDVDAAIVDAGIEEHDARVIGDAGELQDAGAQDAAVDAFVGIDGGPCSEGPDTDGDGVRDVCDVCPSGPDSQDRDGDEVPDACDDCPDGHDAMDDDTDGTPNGCDDWPCGVRPTIPGSVTQEHITISNVSIEGGGNTAVVRAGTQYDFAFSFAIDDTGCASCIDQVELGTSPGTRRYCAYDANPPGTGASGDRMRTWTAPNATTRVDLRFNLGQNFSCEEDGADDWWNGAPPAEQTFGVICVVP